MSGEKKCTKCKQVKKVEDFNFKVRSLGKRQYQCISCSREAIRNHYKNNKQYYLDKATKRNAKIRYQMNRYILEYLLKHPCVDCGEKDVTVLEFDHVKNKLKPVSSLIRAGATSLIEKEIEKCEVRCANCHRRKTAKQFGWFKKKENALVA